MLRDEYVINDYGGIGGVDLQGKGSGDFKTVKGDEIAGRGQTQICPESHAAGIDHHPGLHFKADPKRHQGPVQLGIHSGRAYRKFKRAGNGEYAQDPKIASYGDPGIGAGLEVHGLTGNRGNKLAGGVQFKNDQSAERKPGSSQGSSQVDFCRNTVGADQQRPLGVQGEDGCIGHNGFQRSVGRHFQSR